MNEEDEIAISKFLVTEPKKEKTLYDIIQEKISQKKMDFKEKFEQSNADIEVIF